MQDQLLHAFEYRDGELYWKNPPSKGPVKAGDIAGGIQVDKGRKRRITRFNYRPTLVHRIIWMMHHGDIPDGMVIDHINRDPLDNRIENLRCITQSENLRNSKVPKHNRSGHRHITYIEGRKAPWKVYFSRQFNSLEEAIEWRNKLVDAAHGPDHPPLT